MSIITKQKADKIYGTYAHCSGPCKQGRYFCPTPDACQTLNYKEEDEMDTRPPMNSTDALTVLMLFAAGWGVVAAVLLAFGVRF